MLHYTTTPLPPKWPGKPHTARLKSPFDANWGGTMLLLERELRLLGARNVELAIAVKPAHIRNDGLVRSDARISDPSVILSFNRGADRLMFPCDRFNWWEENVRAIALALEALRKVERYGIQQGKQYEGFKALGSGAERPPEIGADVHALNLARLTDGEIPPHNILGDPEQAKRAIRLARGRAHPDVGGSAAEWESVQAAAVGLSKHHGVGF